LFFFVVVLGFMMFTVALQGETQSSTPQILPGIAFGAIYLSLGFFEAEILPRFTLDACIALFFGVQGVMNAIIISTAIFFVDLITRSRLNERQARERIQELAFQLEGANHKLKEPGLI
jgi:hypothetical protein